MRHVARCTRLLSIILMGLMGALVSCNSATDRKDNKAGEDSAAANTNQPQALKEEMFIKHKVANYAKWKPLYDSDSSNRLANGLHDHIVARGDEDSNMVMVIFYMDDATKAKAMAADARLKEVMQKAGVTGAPEIDYIHRVFNDSSKTDQTARIMIKHKVKDWDTWKKVFDSDKNVRISAGLSDRMVGYSVDDKQMVSLIFVVNDGAKAKAYINDKRLAGKMKEGGIEGQPSVFYYHIVDKHL